MRFLARNGMCVNYGKPHRFPSELLLVLLQQFEICRPGPFAISDAKNRRFTRSLLAVIGGRRARSFRVAIRLRRRSTVSTQTSEATALDDIDGRLGSRRRHGFIDAPRKACRDGVLDDRIVAVVFRSLVAAVAQRARRRWNHFIRLSFRRTSTNVAVVIRLGVELE